MKSIFKLYPWRTILALFLALMTAFLLPGIRVDKHEIIYGFPLSFLSVYPGGEFTHNDILLFQAGFNLNIYFLDFYIFAVIINLIVFLYGKIKQPIKGNPYPPNYYPVPPPSTINSPVPPNAAPAPQPPTPPAPPHNTQLH